MKRTVPFVLLCSALGLAGPAGVAGFAPNDTLVNGRFDQPLDGGWRQQAKDYVGYSEIRLLKDGGMKVRKEMCGNAAITQDVKVAGTDVVLSARTYLTAEATSFGYYSYALLGIGYLDKDGDVLGETRIYSSAGAVPWRDSPTLHLVPVAEKRKWLDREVNVADELKANLKGVDPSRVKALRITFEAFGSGTSAC